MYMYKDVQQIGHPYTCTYKDVQQIGLFMFKT